MRKPEACTPMKEYCNYHPTKLAHWRCPKCFQSFCNACVDFRKGGTLGNQEIQYCRNCNVPVQWVGAANLIEPFWRRLPKFFTYPLHLQPLVLMVALAVAGVVFRQPGLLSTLMRVVIWGIMFKYAFAALKTTAQGNLAPPKIGPETISTDFFQVFKQIGIYFIIFFVYGWLAFKMGPIPATAFLIVALFLVPSMIILLVATGSLLQAVNPMMFVPLAFRIGGGYFIMYFFLLLLGGAPTVIARYLLNLADTLPPEVLVFVFGFAECYYTIISYHLMGYVILQYHEQVGYEVSYENFSDPHQEPAAPVEAAPAGQEDILNSVNTMIKAGKLDEAIDFIKTRTAETGISDLKLSEIYFNLLKMKKRKSDLLAHCPTHLKLMAGANQKSQVCQLYSSCLKLDRSFTPPAETLFKIGDWLNETGKTKAAIHSYNHLTKAYPEDALVPKAYFRSAQIFNDRLMNRERARKILEGLIDRYPDSDIIPMAKAYLAHI
jgi:tetratricopeptide (TPR) repeat protein